MRMDLGPIKIKKLDSHLPTPTYATLESAGIDLFSRIDVEIPPAKLVKIPLGIVIQPPVGHFTLLTIRSSLAAKGLILANGVGIIDRDYSSTLPGEEDEVCALIYNANRTAFRIERGSRICQVLILPVFRGRIVEVEEISSSPRGGFGSTGDR